MIVASFELVLRCRGRTLKPAQSHQSHAPRLADPLSNAAVVGQGLARQVSVGVTA